MNKDQLMVKLLKGMSIGHPFSLLKGMSIGHPFSLLKGMSIGHHQEYE